MTSFSVIARNSIAMAFLGLIALICSGVAGAQNTPANLSRQATDTISKLERLSGYLGDRCSLGFSVSENLYVTSYNSSRNFRDSIRLGDRVLSINSQRLENSYVSYYSVVGKLGPNEIAHVAAERNGEIEEFDIQCENSRPATEAYMKMLRAIAKKNWRQCVSVIGEINSSKAGASASTAYFYLDCGFHAGDFGPEQNAIVAYEYWRSLIEEQKWDPISWPIYRGQVLGILSVYEKNGQIRLANDLNESLRKADSMRSGVSPESKKAPQTASASPRGSGTGFIVDGNGATITSFHVIEGAKKIIAKCGEKEPVVATVVSTNQMVDVALLATNISNSPYLNIARPRSVSVGQKVFTYGFPVTQILGNEPKFTDGSISSLSGIGGEQSYLQISVPVQPGNSGGPVVSESGEVVGIVAAGAAIEPFLKNAGTLPQNVNWAVKAEYAALMFDQPPRQPPSANRDQAISRVAKSLCYIEVY